MAPNHSKLSSTNGMETPRQDVLLPLVPLPPKELDSTTSVVYPLYSDPTNNRSQTYKVTVRKLDGTEDVRTMINWSKDVNKVLTGLGITGDNNYAQAKTVTLSMMTGRVATIYEYRLQHSAELRMGTRAAEAYANDGGDDAAKARAKQAVIDAGWNVADNLRLAHIRHSLNETLTALMPKKVLARCKRHLRRHCRKPRDMKIREYSHLVSMMSWMEFTHLPPWQPNQNLSEEEVMDIILFGIPKSWEKEMERQGFDPLVHTMAQVIGKLEDIESAEGFDAEATKVTPANTKTNKKKPSNGNKNSQTSNESGNGNGKKHCLFHGWGGHTSDECEKLKQQVKKLKTDNGNSNNDKKFGGNNKKGDGKGKGKGSDNFANSMDKIVQKAVKNAMKSNKRKSRDDDSEGSLAAIERLIDEDDLTNITSDQIEKMIITEDGEITF